MEALFELNDEFLSQYPQEKREGQFVLVELRGTEYEHIVGAYASEIEAFKDYKKVSSKKKEIVKADVTFVKMSGINFLYKYEECNN